MSHVVDANVALALVLATPYSDQAQAVWEGWGYQQDLVFAPDLWAYEVTSALRQAMVVTGLSMAGAEACLDTLMQLGVRLVPPTPELDRSALRWAARLGQTAAYDAHYVALAEFLGCQLWTADRRLVAALEPHAAWVRWVGGADGGRGDTSFA